MWMQLTLIRKRGAGVMAVDIWQQMVLRRQRQVSHRPAPNAT
jgi:hypothetical protein